MAISQLSRGLADLVRPQWLGRKGTIKNLFGGTVIATDVGRGQRQLRADPLIPVPQGVLVQLARFRWVVMDAKQIIDGVLILLPAQPVMRHCRPRGHPRGTALPDA